MHEALNLAAAKSSYKNQTSPTTYCDLSLLDKFTSYSMLTRSYLISLLIYCSNILASQAADSLNACANKLTLFSYKNKEEIFLRTPDQIPLLQCRILIGSSIGRCYAIENSKALNIDTNKGLLHMFDERKSVEKAALGLLIYS